MAYCLTNQQVLDHWYVIVDENDTPTLELLRDIPNVTLLYFEFRKGRWSFNKSGGIHMAQKRVHELYPEAWVLLLDSDILLPLDLREQLSKVDLDPKCLYGAMRDFYLTPQQLQENKPVRTEKLGCWGFFHLYYDKTKYCPEWSSTAARYDNEFKRAFGNHLGVRCLPITVKHLGDDRNWRYRKSIRFEPEPVEPQPQ